MSESPNAGDDDAEPYPDLPPDQLRRLACLDRALDWAAENTPAVTAQNRASAAAQIVADARIFDAFVAGT